MQPVNANFRHRILVEWSDEDQLYVARVPALPACAAHAPTAKQAAQEAQRAMAVMLDVRREDEEAPARIHQRPTKTARLPTPGGGRARSQVVSIGASISRGWRNW